MTVEKERVAVSEFGTLLRRHRLAAGLSQDALAERAKMSSVGISALERGDRRSPYRDTVALLAQALRLAPDDAAEFETVAARQRPRKLRGELPPPSGHARPREVAPVTPDDVDRPAKRDRRSRPNAHRQPPGHGDRSGRHR